MRDWIHSPLDDEIEDLFKRNRSDTQWLCWLSALQVLLCLALVVCLVMGR